MNRRQFYVSVSRAVEDARLYTDDRRALARVVSREQSRESALSLVERVPARQTRVAVLRRETPLDLARRSDARSGRERADGGALGSDRRGPDAYRGRHPFGRGAKVRQERLSELLAPSEAASQARTQYLDKVTREQLSGAEQRVVKLSEEVLPIARHLNDCVVQMPARLAEVDARRWSARERRERWQMVMGLLAMLHGGFLAGQVASYRSGAIMNTTPAATEQQGPSAAKSAPSAPRRPATKPRAAAR